MNKRILPLLPALCLLVLLAASAFAMGTWEEGRISKSVWGKNPQKIEINSVQYVLLQGVQIYQMVPNEDKSGFNLTPQESSVLRAGKEINFKSLGLQISQIELRP